MLNLDANIELDAGRFWRWWRRELLSMMPERLRNVIEPKQGRLILKNDGSEIEASYWLEDRHDSVGRFQRNAEGMKALREMMEQNTTFDKAEVVIRLNESEAIAKNLVLPLAAAENIEQVAAYEIDRYTPFKRDQVYFAVKVLEKNKQSGQVSLLLIASPKDRLDGMVDLLLEAGIEPVRADFETVDSDTENHEAAYNLLPSHLRKKTPVLPGLVHGGLFALFIVLLITAIVLPVWRQDLAIEELREAVYRIEKEARSVDNLQKEADTLIAQTAQLIEKKQDYPSVVEMLNELSRLINDDTWLTYLQYNSGRLQFQGQSPSASTLIGVLEASPLFNNARFVSPVTQDPRGGGERFQITADVVARKPE